MDACLAPILFVLVISVSAVQSQILKGPKNALKKVGDSVMLECATRSNNCDAVEWVKMEGAQSPKTVYQNGVILNGFRDGRYNVSSTGGCNLTITQLQISDSGRFTCSQLIDSTQYTKGSVLVVIDITESCRSNVTSNALAKDDGYSFWTAISVPAKSVEPSNVTLSFLNKTVDETETTDDKQPPTTVKTTLTGIAGKENIKPRACGASLPQNTVAEFDSSTATLDLCTTQQLTVSYPVENIAISPTDGYHKGMTVICTADGYPIPTFLWKNMTNGLDVQRNGTMVLTVDSVGHNFTCRAKNTVNGKEMSLDKTIFVDPETKESGCSPGCVAGIVCGVIVICGAGAGAGFVVLKKKKKDDDRKKAAGESVLEPLKGQPPTNPNASGS